jgi:hypothetical protein
MIIKKEIIDLQPTHHFTYDNNIKGRNSTSVHNELMIKVTT